MYRALLSVVCLSIGLSACQSPEASAENVVDFTKIKHPGAALYQSACLSCHVVTAKEGEGVAPPIFAVRDHMLKVYPERDAFIARMVKWVHQPDAQDVLMPGAVRKFGLMPALPQLAEADLQAIAAFVYETDFGQPDWYQAHYQAEHGKPKP